MITSGALNDADEDGRLTIAFSGGLADSGALLLSEYSVSLQGWRDLTRVLGELYLHSFPELRRVRGNDLLRVDVVAERQGSYETVLVFTFGAVAGGILGNRADAAVVWSFSKLIGWYKKAIGGYIRAKSLSSDVTKIAAALDQMATEAGIPLVEQEVAEADSPLFEFSAKSDDEPPEDDESLPLNTVKGTRVLAEIIDQALQRATQPLAHSCERLKVFVEHQPPLLEIGPAERAVILEPLSLPPPKREWSAARIKFQRINDKTGRALFTFERENDDGAAHYSRIIDPTVHRPHNPYTRSFYEGIPLDVWIREVSPEKGKLNFQWEIRVSNPDQGTLFNIPPGE